MHEMRKQAVSTVSQAVQVGMRETARGIAWPCAGAWDATSSEDSQKMKKVADTPPSATFTASPCPRLTHPSSAPHSTSTARTQHTRAPAPPAHLLVYGEAVVVAERQQADAVEEALRRTARRQPHGSPVQRSPPAAVRRDRRSAASGGSGSGSTANWAQRSTWQPRCAGAHDTTCTP